MTDFITKDSGERRPFDTGAHRDVATGKGRYDLLPPEGIKRLAQLFERGAEKYDDRNWEKGIPLSVYADSMLRHAFQAAAGQEDEDHLAAVAWNALCMATTQQRIREGLLPAELDDLPNGYKVQQARALNEIRDLFLRTPRRVVFPVDWKVDGGGEVSRPLLHPDVVSDLHAAGFGVTRVVKVPVTVYDD